MRIPLKNKLRLISGFIAATIAICTLPFFISPKHLEAAVISSNAMVSDEDVKEAGYMSSKAFRDAVIDACRRMDGVKYQWGGGGYNGIDCAGSVSIAYGVAMGTVTITATPGTYGNKTLSFSGGGTPDKYGFDKPGFAGIRSSFTNGLFKIRNITPSENHFSDFETNGESGIQNDEWITIIKTYGFQPGDAIMWWNDSNDSVNAQHITIYAGTEGGVPMHWTASSTAGYFCKKPLADSTQEAGKGYFSGFMGVKGTTVVDSAYAGFVIDKRDREGINYTGCIFSIYSDPLLNNKTGELRDDDGDGIYNDLYILKNGSYVKQRYEMSRKSDSPLRFEDSLYFKETTGPSGVILPDGTKISLKDSDGKVPDKYNYVDDTVYAALISISDCDGEKARLEYSIRSIDGEEFNSDVNNAYPYIEDKDEILITNVHTTGSASETGIFADAAGIRLEKTTSSAVDTSSTVFTVEEEDGTVVAVYKFTGMVWNWFDANGNKWDRIAAFPVKIGHEYIIREEFSKGEPFKCYDGSTIDYEIRNDSGWTKVSDTTYKTGFATMPNEPGNVYVLTCENNIDSGKIRVTKKVTDGDDTPGGFVFELWNQDRTKLAAVGRSADDGNVYWETGSGKNLASFELPSGTYYLAEVSPSKFYDGASGEYTYVSPDGFKDEGDGKWYKEITITSEDRTEEVTNDRSEACLKVMKSSEDGKIEDIGFAVFFGGKGDQPVWESASLAMGSTDSEGVLVFEHLPTGWYRIDEQVSPEYKVTWDDGTKGRSRVIRITEKDDNRTLTVKADNKIDMTPAISTELTGKDLSHDVLCGTEVFLKDRVSYENLLLGYEYVISGSLVDSRTGETLKRKDGKEYASSIVFTADGSSGEINEDEQGRQVVKGYIDVMFKVDTGDLFAQAFKDGEDTLYIVCFETLSYKGIDLAVHNDLNDDFQTVRVSPEISTSAYDTGTCTNIMTLSDSLVVCDKVSFTGLVPGEIYKVTGTLMDRSTGKVYLDPDGNTYTREVRFVPNSSYGYVNVFFEDVHVPLDNVELVVFERLSIDSSQKIIAVHEDINDDFQTVRRPSCSTIATTEKGAKMFLENTEVTVIDRICYQDLAAGHKYYAKAALLNSDGTNVVSKGQAVMSIEVFEPVESSGTVEVTLRFDSSSLKSGDRVVVIENIYDMLTDEEISLGIQTEDVHVLSHEDLNNMDQSLTVTNIPKTGEQESSAMYTGLALVIVAVCLSGGVVMTDHRRRTGKR